MDNSIPNSNKRRSTNFQPVADAFLAQPGLPFADLLSAQRIKGLFQKHNGLFGSHGVYTTAVTLWAFLSQVMRDGKETACQSAVARVVTHCELAEIKTPTDDTGDYCRARAKLPEAALHELTCDVASELEENAESPWLWKGMHAKLIDGFTLTMPDTPENQSEYPQQRAQKPGIGFPIARVVTVVSLATACALDAAIGPFRGKQTGEPALLRSIFHAFLAGDIAVADRLYCSFMQIALFLGRGVHSCVRMHPTRHTDYRKGRRLGKNDYIIEWTRPDRPKWMDKATYATMPKTLELRVIRYMIVENGFRTKELTVVTTLLDPEEYTLEEIAELYGFRWNVELDIRSIKQSLNLGHLRCKSPEMVRREFWTTFLAYNLIRTTAASAASLHGKKPRQISFTSTCQYVLSAWENLSNGLVGPSGARKLCLVLLSQIASCEVAQRPGRLEPRVLKRRRHGYPLMQKPRHVLRRKLRKTCA